MVDVEVVELLDSSEDEAPPKRNRRNTKKKAARKKSSQVDSSDTEEFELDSEEEEEEERPRLDPAGNDFATFQADFSSAACFLYVAFVSASKLLNSLINFLANAVPCNSGYSIFAASLRAAMYKNLALLGLPDFDGVPLGAFVTATGAGAATLFFSFLAEYHYQEFPLIVF